MSTLPVILLMMMVGRASAPPAPVTLSEARRLPSEPGGVEGSLSPMAFSFQIPSFGKREERGPDSPESVLQFQLYLYRVLVADVLGTDCPMEPTCGRFSYRALRRTNDFRGATLTMERLLKEQDVHRDREPVWQHGRWCYPDPVEGYLKEGPSLQEADLNALAISLAP